MTQSQSMLQEIEKMAIFQGKNGAIELKGDIENETIWASQKQIAEIFNVTSQNITIHLKNIFDSGELDITSTCKKSLQVQKEGKRTVKRNIKEYNLDVLISIGYRIDSVVGTKFRKWATQTLNNHITKGYTINETILKEKQNLYLKVLEDIRILAKDNKSIGNDEIIDLIKTFGDTWFNLETYDKQELPKIGTTKKEISVSAKELYQELELLKKDLISKKQATDFFAQEKQQGSLEGILGNVLQTVFGKDAYETIEEKAAHLLYFVIKNHYFTDGNKRAGAFSFIWFLQKTGFEFKQKITPETLTVLTLLIAESNPKEKEKIIGLILLILK